MFHPEESIIRFQKMFLQLEAANAIKIKSKCQK